MSETASYPPCPDEILALLSAYMDGETTPPETAEIEAHLQTCPACQAELDSLLATAGALSALAKSDPAAPPPDFVQAVQSTIRHRSRDRFFGVDSTSAITGTPAPAGSGGGLRATYNAVAVAMLLILAAAAVSLLPPARVSAPKLTGIGGPISDARAFRVVIGGVTEAEIRRQAERVGATDIQAMTGGRGLDIRMPRGDAEALLNALRALGPTEKVQRLVAPAADARGDRVEVWF